MSKDKICIQSLAHTTPEPDFSLWNSILDVFASVATIIAASITAYAVYIALKQLKESRTQNSIGLYQQYLQLCIQYPHFAKGIAKPQTKNCPQYGQYLWFVATMLNCFEQLILSNSDDQQWLNTIEKQLIKHKEALSQSSSLNRDEWDSSLLKMINKVLDE